MVCWADLLAQTRGCVVLPDRGVIFQSLLGKGCCGVGAATQVRITKQLNIHLVRSMKAGACLHEALLPVAKVCQGWDKECCQVLEQTDRTLLNRKVVQSLSACCLSAAARFGEIAVRFISVSLHGLRTWPPRWLILVAEYLCSSDVRVIYNQILLPRSPGPQEGCRGCS